MSDVESFTPYYALLRLVILYLGYHDHEHSFRLASLSNFG